MLTLEEQFKQELIKYVDFWLRCPGVKRPLGFDGVRHRAPRELVDYVAACVQSYKSGFEKLWAAGALDRTLEALVCDERFRSLFGKPTRDAAGRRLGRQASYP